MHWITHRSASTAKHTPGVCFGYAHRVCVGLVVWGLMAGAVLGGTSPAWAKEKVEEGWYPFSFPEKLDPDSPANIGKLVLDAPAGKHGFVKVKDGHFQFEDGTPIKFWGTNLAMGACFPDKKQAELMADRLAFFGFNAVRLHHMDFGFEPTGIFEDIAPMYKDPQMKETGTLSKIQLDRLDYLIYLLKQRGIYVDMNLLVSRHFTKADGVIDADKLTKAAKPVSMFDPKLIELQKQYAKDLLTHYNPYTKTRYADEPDIALIEITNENSILAQWKSNNLNGSLYGLRKNTIPDHYIKTLDLKWNEWLINKYGTVEHVKNAWAARSHVKAENAGAIINSPSDISSWRMEQRKGAKAHISISNEAATIDIQQITATPWHIQFFRTGFNLKKDKLYVISFIGRSEAPAQIRLFSQRASSPWTGLNLAETIALSREPVNVEIPFAPSENCTNAKIGFTLGQSTGTISIKNIVVREFTAGSWPPEDKSPDFTFRRPLHKLLLFEPEQKQKDIAQFYNDLQDAYFSEMSEFLKGDLGVKIPLTGIGGIRTEEDLTTENGLDFVDYHAYWDHPRFPGKRWDRNNFRINNTSMLSDDNMGIIGRFEKALPETLGKPRTLTEWNHCYPNTYAYETPLILAASARENNWDGLFQFAFSHGWTFSPELDAANNYFDSIANPQRLITTAWAGAVYLSPERPVLNKHANYYEIRTSLLSATAGFIKGKDISVGPVSFVPEENGVILVYSVDGQPIENSGRLIVIALSEIKNSGSQWKENKFEWGTAPTLLKKMPAVVKIKAGKKLEAFALNAAGQRAKKIPSTHVEGILSISTQNIATPWFEITDQ